MSLPEFPGRQSHGSVVDYIWAAGCTDLPPFFRHFSGFYPKHLAEEIKFKLVLFLLSILSLEKS